MKSKASASSTNSTSVSVKCPGSTVEFVRRSGVFEYDAFDDVRDVLALVGGGLERLIDRFELDHLAHVAFGAEQLRNRATHHLVRVGFELVYPAADPQDRGRVGHRRHQPDR